MYITFDAKLLAAVAIAQGNEETRYYLKGVYFADDTAVATDGHMMTVASNGHNNPGDHIMPVSKKAVTALKSRNSDIVVLDGDTLTVFDRFGEALYMETSKEIDGTYPDWQRITVEGGYPCKVALSSKILARIAKTSEALRKNAPVTITGDQPENPQHVDYHNKEHDVYSVVMPMRV
tara:strand:+ start:2501 stop:3031 length:531 start_codon:yes stop_codon:yes gene_type:complete